MNITITPKTALAATVAASALLFALGANSQPDPEDHHWSISAVSGEDPGAYVIDQKTGDVYFIKKNTNISSRDLRVKLLGNMKEVR